jgi:hypothetical protein
MREGWWSRVVAVAVAVTAAGVLPSVVGPAPSASAAVDPAVVINEIDYHPPVDGREFLELHNPGDSPASLDGACFTSGITGCFGAGAAIPAGGFVVVAESPTDYAAAYPGAPAPLLDYGGGLSNSGERVTLSLGAVVLDTVAYLDSAPWPASADGSGASLELIDPLADNDVASAWGPSTPAPTPGAVNTRYGQGPLPEITDVAVGPAAADAPIPVAAAVSGTTTVAVDVTVGFAAPERIAMVDDGAHGDGAAGDARFGALIPGVPAGTLVRYRIVATAGDAEATVPDAGDARPRLGLVVDPPTPPTAVPILQWWIAPDDLQHLFDHKLTNDYEPAAISYGAEVWDGALVRVQGTSRTQSKLSFKFKMPKGHDLVAPGLIEHPVGEFVIDGDPSDPLGVTPLLALSVYGDGNPLLAQRAKVRVLRDGGYLGLFTFLEEYEDDWLARVGLDGPGDQVFEPEGTDGVLIDEGSAAALVPRFEKLSPGDDDDGDLHDLVAAIDAPPTPARSARLRDLFDVPALVDYLAVGALVQQWDQTVHNFELVRDGDTGRWRFIPTDLDSSLGAPLQSATTGARIRGLFPFGPDNLVSALRTDPVVAELYLRRLRTLADRYLAGGELQARADALAPVVAADVALDRQTWSAPYTQAQGEAQLSAYLAYRRHDLLVAHRRDGEVPAAPTPGATAVISEVAYAAVGGPGHDLVELHNPSPVEAVDVSGWALSGAASAVLPAGTVIPAGGYLVVPGDQEATAAERPSGTLVAGELAAGVADGGGTIELRDATGALHDTVAVGTTDPWPTAPAAGAATLERVSPTADGTLPASWRASTGPGGSPGASGDPAGPVPAARLEVRAAADQVELAPGDGSGAALTVVVANTGSAARPAVALSGPGTTCGRSLGTLSPGAWATVRCATTGDSGAEPDRTYRFTAASGAVTATSPPVEVRTLRHQTQYLERYLPGPPTGPAATVGAGGAVRLTWTPPPSATAAPLRWMVVTGTGPGEAVPSYGSRVAPGGAADLADLPLDRPVQLAVAARNRSGTGPRTAPTPFLTPRASASFPFADAATAIGRIYADLDGRQPTAAELAIWQAFLAGGGSLGDVVANRLAERPWAGQVEPVTRLYLASFGRMPDQAGLAYWVRRLRGGLSLDAIASRFAATSEFRTRFGALDDAGFVTQVYRNVLGREPDGPGLAHWVGRLAAGRTRGQVLVAFAESSEGRRRLDPRARTSVVWTALLHATPSAADAQPAVDWLAGGGALATVAEGVRTSDRYAAAVG